MRTRTARVAEVVPFPGPVPLSLLPCRVCGEPNPVVIACNPVTDEEWYFCGFEHARQEGWPWLGRQKQDGRRISTDRS